MKQPLVSAHTRSCPESQEEAEERWLRDPRKIRHRDLAIPSATWHVPNDCSGYFVWLVFAGFFLHIPAGPAS